MSISEIKDKTEQAEAIVNAFKTKIADYHTIQTNMGAAFSAVTDEWEKMLTDLVAVKDDGKQLADGLQKLLGSVKTVKTLGLVNLVDAVKPAAANDANPPASLPSLVTPTPADNVHILDTAEVVVADKAPENALVLDTKSETDSTATPEKASETSQIVDSLGKTLLAAAEEAVAKK